jgi:hypothetical protein
MLMLIKLKTQYRAVWMAEAGTLGHREASCKKNGNQKIKISELARLT